MMVVSRFSSFRRGTTLSAGCPNSLEQSLAVLFWYYEAARPVA